MSQAERREQIEEEFKCSYEAQPSLWVRAPGRVDLMGSHTDYNQGYVLTMAIEQDTWIAARPRLDRRVSICSMNVPGEACFDLDKIHKDEQVRWSNYVRGVAAVLQAEGHLLTGFDGLIHSTIPVGSGLSSSAALEVATALLFKSLGKLEIEPIRLALLCQQAENEFVGVNCGILDQYSSMMGQAGCSLELDCRDLSSRSIPLDAGVKVVICDTRAKRELTGSEYAERRSQCDVGMAILSRYYSGVRALRDVSMEQLERQACNLEEVVYRRCRFIIEENQRVGEMGAALAAGERASIRRLTQASYEGARDLYEIGSPEMQTMLDAMLDAPGVIGARQAGAGFGGCLVAFVEQEEEHDFGLYVERAYMAATGIQPFVYPVQPVDGANLIAFSSQEGALEGRESPTRHRRSHERI